MVNRAFALWLPFLVVTTGFFLFATWAVQQTYREGLDDPQIQMAEDAARRLAGGEAPANVVPQNDQAAKLDMRESLLPWLAVYDASGTPLASSAPATDACTRCRTPSFATRSATSLPWRISPSA